MKRFGINFSPCLSIGLASKVALIVLASSLASGAQAQDAKKSPSSPVGGAWESQVDIANNDSGAQVLTPEQTNAIAIVNTYFRDLINLSGQFVQVDPDLKQTKGKFYVQKPGKFRFDYSAPSQKIIISDGRLLAIQDLDLRNEDVYELSNTPFRILLRENVDLLNDARILDVTSNEQQVSVTLADKNPDAIGRITIVIGLQPEPTLLGWITADGQGQNTNVTVSDISRPEKLDSKLFKRKLLFNDVTNIGSQ